MKLNFLRMTALLSFVFLQNIQANTPIFTYTSRDLLLVFRKTGYYGGSTSPNVLEINLGQVSTYYGATPGSTISITQLPSGKLGTTFDSLNDVSWSVGTCVPAAGDSGDSSYPVKTLWTTDPRTDPLTPATPWQQNAATVQGSTAARMVTILANASFYSGTVSSNANNNTNLIIIPASNGNNAGANLGSVNVANGIGNYHDSFEGNVENTTPDDFTTGGQPSRSDLYQLLPDTTGTQPNGKYLGYFELRTNGTVVFVAASTAVSIPNPTLGISRSGNTRTISFLTVSGATYTLYYTNSFGLANPLSNWASIPTNITGDGTIRSFQQTVTATDTNRFYRVGAH